MLPNAHFLYSWYYNIWSYKLDNGRGVGAENGDRHSPGSHVFATPQRVTIARKLIDRFNRRGDFLSPSVFIFERLFLVSRGSWTLAVVTGPSPGVKNSSCSTYSPPQVTTCVGSSP